MPSKENKMEEIKGMSEAEARKHLMRRGWGLGEIDEVLGVKPATDEHADERKRLMRSGMGIGEVELELAAKAKPAPAPTPKAAPKPAAKPAPKADK